MMYGIVKNESTLTGYYSKENDIKFSVKSNTVKSYLWYWHPCCCYDCCYNCCGWCYYPVKVSDYSYYC